MTNLNDTFKDAFVKGKSKLSWSAFDEEWVPDKDDKLKELENQLWKNVADNYTNKIIADTIDSQKLAVAPLMFSGMDIGTGDSTTCYTFATPANNNKNGNSFTLNTFKNVFNKFKHPMLLEHKISVPKTCWSSLLVPPKINEDFEERFEREYYGSFDSTIPQSDLSITNTYIRHQKEIKNNKNNNLIKEEILMNNKKIDKNVLIHDERAIEI